MNLFLKQLYFNILEEEAIVVNNNNNDTSTSLSYKNISLQINNSDDKLLHKFCQNAFKSMLNEVPIQLSRDGGKKYLNVNTNISTSLVFGSFTSFLALDIYNQLLNAYNSINNTNQMVATKHNEKNIDDNKSRKIIAYMWS